jgi:hypothetical protein
MTAITDPAEMARKLAQIAGLDGLQLQGWMQTAKARGFFPGEHEALLRREKAVGG